MFLKDFLPDKLKANAAAIEEDQNLQERCIISSFVEMQFSIFLVNIRSLPKQFEDLLNDIYAKKSKHICLVETWINPKETNVCEFEVGGRDFDHASIGKGKGCAILSEILDEPNLTSAVTDKVINDKYQMIVVLDGCIQLVIVYLSNNCSLNEVSKTLDTFLRRDLTTILAGDFNFDAKEENALTKFLMRNQFVQLITEPNHVKGRIIDHCYVPLGMKDKIQLTTHSPYYTNHDAFCISFNS